MIYLGYNFTSPVPNSTGGDLIPQRLQNLCIRDYAQTRGLRLDFSLSEYWDTRGSLMLMSQLNRTADPEFGGLILFSVACLPPDLERRNHFIRHMAEHGKDLHFALEGLSNLSPDDLKNLYWMMTDQRLERTRDRLISGELFNRKP